VWLWLAVTASEPRPGKILGEVTEVQGGRLVVRADDGASVVLSTDASTRCVKTRPGAATLDGALAIAIGDVAVRDRILAAGALSADGTALSARQVVVMSRGDIAAKQEQERAEWRQRGLSGVVTALDPDKHELAVDVRGGKAKVIVSTAEKKATFRRYASDSAKFDDARPSALADMKVGDQVRVLGDRSEDGTRVVAEQVVSGAFRTTVCTVDAVDADKGELRVAEGARPQKLTVALGRGAMLRRLQPEHVKEVKGGANLTDLLERMPAVTLAELKAGDRVAVSSAGPVDSRLTAVVLVAGIEPLLAPPAPGRSGGATLMPGLPGGALDMGIGP
jgi:hypothetical protein